MKVVTYEGVVENGCVRLPAGVLLPEKAKVYVVVPGTEVQPVAHLRSLHLADPAQAGRFNMDVTHDKSDIRYGGAGDSAPDTRLGDVANESR